MASSPSSVNRVTHRLFRIKVRKVNEVPNIATLDKNLFLLREYLALTVSKTGSNLCGFVTEIHPHSSTLEEKEYMGTA